MREPLEDEWEQDLDRRLKALPELSAPENLIRNVLARIEQRRLRAWYQRPYYTWPNSLKWGMGAFAVVLATLFTIGYYYGINVWSVSSARSEWSHWLEGVSRVAESIDKGLSMTTRVVLGQYALGLLVFASLIYGSLFGAGAYVWKALRKKMEDQYAV